jgi:hypothetical protein
MKNIIFILLVVLSSVFHSNLYSQVYYGKKELGKFEIINDSICTVSFINIPGSAAFHVVDTCSYIKAGDTIFISTKVRNKFEIIPYDKPIPTRFGVTVSIKVYFKKNNRLVFTNETVQGKEFALDTINNQLLFKKKYVSVYDGNILLFYTDMYGYTRLKLDNSYSFNDYLLIKFNKMNTNQSVFFDSFPLIMRKNKIIPIDKTQQEKCWVDNGFYFPKMKKSSTIKEYNGIFWHEIGISGLTYFYMQMKIK